MIYFLRDNPDLYNRLMNLAFTADTHERKLLDEPLDIETLTLEEAKNILRVMVRFNEIQMESDSKHWLQQRQQRTKKSRSMTEPIQ